MNIAVNTRLLLKDRMEGIAVFTWEICKRMVVDHPDDTFYFFFDRTPDPSFTDFNNVTPVVLKPMARHPLLWKYWFDYRLPKAFKTFKIDVFFSPESYLSLKTQVPTVMVTHDLSFLHYPDAYKSSHLNYFINNGPAFHKKAAHIIAVSETTKKDIQKQYGITSSKISIAYNAVRHRFKPIYDKEKLQIQLGISKGYPYLIYLGSIHPRKNIQGLIKGFEIWKQQTNSTHRLILFGRWAFGNKELKKVLDSSPYRGHIVLCGDEDGNVETIMAAADCFLYPSFHEGFGIPIIEAMACGIPVVTSGKGAMKEVGADAAIYIDPEDPNSIADGITHALEENTLEPLSAKMKTNLGRFSWDDSADIIYESLKKYSVHDC